MLTACDRPSPPRPEPASPPPKASQAPAAETPFFVGRWAASVDACADRAWVIDRQGLETPGETDCRFKSVSRTSTGYEAQAECTAEAPAAPYALKFAYAQSARALLIEGGPFADVGLVRCEAPLKPPEPGTPGGLADDRTPVSEAPFTPTSAQGAANVVQTYFALVEQRKFADAYRLWSDGGRATGEATAEAFAGSFSRYSELHGQVGAPGRIEGAAGSLYVEVPVTTYGRTSGGQAEYRTGKAVLRRVNDVPGSTPEQRAWHIQSMPLKPAPPPP
jgi:hypothetical protein